MRLHVLILCWDQHDVKIVLTLNCKHEAEIRTENTHRSSVSYKSPAFSVAAFLIVAADSVNSDL